MQIACIGSRDLNPFELDWCRQIGQLIAELGFALHSGNAPGADQAYAVGANRVDPTLVHLHLPWGNFHREAVVEGNHTHVYPFDNLRFYTDIAAECHTRWNYLKPVVRKLHTRNSSILVPKQENVDICVAWPSQKIGGGGTGQGMRIAASRGIRLIDLTQKPAQEVVQWLREAQSSADSDDHPDLPED